MGNFVFKKRVLRRIFEPKSTKVVTDWMQLHVEELYNLFLHHMILGSPYQAKLAGRGIQYT
jgi:hypothetical protein